MTGGAWAASAGSGAGKMDWFARVIGMTFGYNSGYAINPARDFGPRLFTYFAGWGKAVFTANDNWWWVPIVAPIVGAILGAWAYDAFINRHHVAPQAGQ